MRRQDPHEPRRPLQCLVVNPGKGSPRQKRAPGLLQQRGAGAAAPARGRDRCDVKMLLKMVPKLLVLEGVFLLVLNDVHANGEHLDVYEDDKTFFYGDGATKTNFMVGVRQR